MTVLYMTASSVPPVENNSILGIRLEDNNNHGVSPSSFNIKRFKSPDSFVIYFLDQRAKKHNIFYLGSEYGQLHLRRYITHKRNHCGFRSKFWYPSGPNRNWPGWLWCKAEKLRNPASQSIKITHGRRILLHRTIKGGVWRHALQTGCGKLA